MMEHCGSEVSAWGGRWEEGGKQGGSEREQSVAKGRKCVCV